MGVNVCKQGLGVIIQCFEPSCCVWAEHIDVIFRSSSEQRHISTAARIEIHQSFRFDERPFKVRAPFAFVNVLIIMFLWPFSPT